MTLQAGGVIWGRVFGISVHRFRRFAQILSWFAEVPIARGILLRKRGVVRSQVLIGYGTSGRITSGVTDAPEPLVLPVDPANTVLRVSFLSYNHANGEDMTLFATFGMSPNESGFSTSKGMSLAGGQFVDISMAAFSGTELDSLSLTFASPAGTNYLIDSISLVTVREPTTMAIAPFLLIAGLRRERRGLSSCAAAAAFGVVARARAGWHMRRLAGTA